MVKAVILEKLQGLRPVIKLNEPMDMSHQSNNLFKIHTCNADKKILFVIFSF